jgi:hypothetical protein
MLQKTEKLKKQIITHKAIIHGDYDLLAGIALLNLI